jgi:hypothetical protein
MLWLGGAAVGEPMTFTDVTEDVGIAHLYSPPTEDTPGVGEMIFQTGGAVAEDFDGDGWVDLFVLQSAGDPHLLYMNRGDGTFADEAAARGADLTGAASGVAAADFDADGDIDICVTMLPGPHVLLLNDAAGNFSPDLTMLPFPAGGNASSPSWGDVDNDGLLDLVIGQWAVDPVKNLWIYRNQGGGVLESYEFHESPHPDKSVFSPVLADVTGDRLADLLVVADFERSQLYHNLGDARFRNMGVAVGDCDNDGDLDWFATSIFAISTRAIGNRLYRNDGDGLFTDVTDEAGVMDGGWGWGASFGDLDLDGDLDIFHVNGWEDDAPFFFDACRLFENRGDGTFDEVAEAAGADNRGQGRGMLLADFDNDGDLDIYICNHQEVVVESGNPSRIERLEPGIPALLRNDTATANHWLKVTLEGQTPLHPHGIGSRVLVTTGGITQMREINASTNYVAQGPGRIAHFGFGDAAVADEVCAEWITGDATFLVDVPADQALSLSSPRATVSKRSALVGEAITASGEGVEPLGVPREWVIGGQTFSDPVSISFASPGPKELRLNLYEPDGTTLLRGEILRIIVEASLPSGLLSW